MKLDLALIADAATVDGSGKLNILGVFDHIAVADFPARHERMCLVMRFRAEAPETGQHEIEVVIRDPSKEEMARMTGSIDLGAAVGRESVHIPQVLHLDGFVFPKAGVYTIEVEIDGEMEQAVDLEVSKATRIPQA
ncbi:MAG: hypothetical protein P8188_01255 [Gemmatimonadota bacterium]|jgi:hypothetical protein